MMCWHRGMIKHPSGVWQSSTDRDFWASTLLAPQVKDRPCPTKQASTRVEANLPASRLILCMLPRSLTQSYALWSRKNTGSHLLRVDELRILTTHQQGVFYLFFRELPTLNMHHQQNFPVTNITCTCCARCLCFCIPWWKYTDGAGILVPTPETFLHRQ